MDKSRARKRLLEIGREREAHERAVLAERGPLARGSLVERWTRCGRPGCKCGKGEPHGPFLYLSHNESGKTRWFYIGKASRGRLARAALAYREFADHIRALHKLAREAEVLYKTLQRGLLCSPRALRQVAKEVE